MTDRIRVGIVGATVTQGGSGWGANAHVPALKALPNFGAAYGRRFDAIYPDLAREHAAVLVPFVLEGVAGVAALNQADGVHPTEEGQKKMADLVWAALEGLLASPPSS